MYVSVELKVIKCTWPKGNVKLERDRYRRHGARVGGSWNTLRVKRLNEVRFCYIRFLNAGGREHSFQKKWQDLGVHPSISAALWSNGSLILIVRAREALATMKRSRAKAWEQLSFNISSRMGTWPQR
jgi:hypothetical protein